LKKIKKEKIKGKIEGKGLIGVKRKERKE